MKNCLDVNWDTWNAWSKDNEVSFYNGAKKSSSKCPEDCNVIGTGTTPKKGIGNGEQTLAMELLGDTAVGGGGKVSDITDDARPHNFGHISIKEYADGCKDVRLGTHVASAYHKFKASYLPLLCTWLLHYYYQNDTDKRWKESAWTQQSALINRIQQGYDGALIEKIRSTLYDDQFYRVVNVKETKQKKTETFILHDAIIVGAVCSTNKIDKYKELILSVQTLINKYSPKFHDAFTHRMKLTPGGIPTDFTRFYYIRPEDFLNSGDGIQVPDYIHNMNFIALLNAVEGFPSDVPSKSTYLDVMVRTEALGGFELHQAIMQDRDAAAAAATAAAAAATATTFEQSYIRYINKPVLIYVREDGFFPVGVITYNEIICDRISEDKPKIGIKSDGLISEKSQLGKHKKASGKSPASPASAKSPASAGPAAKKTKHNG